MESSSSSAIIFEAPGFLRIYEDGNVERLVDRETVPPSSEDDNFDEEKDGVASKDVVLDPQTGVFVRLYLPRLEVMDGKGKVPVLLYFHGGGFCIGSVASPVYHSYLNKVAAEAKVICVSVDYRRAPEHRLPAAYDDCFGALEWLDRQAMALNGVSVDPWLASHADFSNVFLAGDSAGANILHQVGIRAGERKWDGVCLQGAILVHPFFGGEERIGCELEADAEVEGFNIMTDAIWSISLPSGADKDHPFRNPVGPRSPALSTLVYPRTLVFVAGPYVHHEHPKAPLLAVGTSIGANILVKYLGEEGENTPLAGGAAICCPWDLVICGRFIKRSFVQRVYDKILTTGLRGYAQLHQSTVSRLADWELIKKSHSIRDFDNYFTCRIGKFETVDTYYRKCSSAQFLSNVSVPLLCVNALDDPVCTKEAIPWDECRANKNIVLATTLHGGHLAFFEGLMAGSVWWVRAVKEFLSVLHSSSLMHTQKKVQTSGLSSTLTSSIDKGPYLNVSEDGMVSTDNNICMDSEGDDRVMEELLLPSKSSMKISGENEGVDGEQPHAATDTPFMQEPKLEEGSVEYSQLKLSNGEKGSIFEIRIKSCAEFIVLQSVLRQLLNQMQATTQGKTVLNVGPKNSETDVFSQFGGNKVIDVHKTSEDDLTFCNSDGCAHVNAKTGPSNEHVVQKQRTSDDISNKLVPIKAIMQLSRQQKRSMWILAYIAIVTTWPLVGSVLVFNFKRKVKNMWSATWHGK